MAFPFNLEVKKTGEGGKWSFDPFITSAFQRPVSVP